jgi:hypothetical protein
MEHKRDNWKVLLRRALYAATFLMVTSLYPLLNRYTGREKVLVTFLDRLIPFNKYFVFVYVYWYFYMAVFLIYFWLNDPKKYYKILIGFNVGMIISYFIYMVYPTTVPRPVFSYDGTGVVDWLFRWLYGRDNPYNCFPSIHVINSLVLAIYVQKDNMYLSRLVKAFSWVSALAIIYSTFAIRQHVILDAVSAAVIAYGMYFIMDYKEITAWIKSRRRGRVFET